MKRILYSLFCLLSLLSLPCTARAAEATSDYLTATVVQMEDGTTWQVDIALVNPTSANYTAFQMDVTLPEGFAYVEESAVPGSRISPTHSVVAAVHPDGFLRLTAYAPNNAAINGSDGTDGPLVSFQFRVTDAAQPGSHTIAIGNVRFSSRTGMENQLPDAATDFVYSNRQEMQSHHLIYMVDGEVYEDLLVEEGTAIEPLAAPEKEGHTFSGWDGLPETMPTEDVTVSATYTVNEYTLTYYLDGEVYKTETVAYGEAIVPPVVEVPAGKEFSGWADLPETMPAEDVEVHGTLQSTGIAALSADSVVDVYNLRGILVRRGIVLKRIGSELPAGIYIAGGKLVRVSR